MGNKARNSIGLLYWMLAREVLRLRGTISRQSWDVWSTSSSTGILRRLRSSSRRPRLLVRPPRHQPAIRLLLRQTMLLLSQLLLTGAHLLLPLPLLLMQAWSGVLPLPPSGAHLSMLVLPRLPGGNRRISVRECKGLSTFVGSWYQVNTGDLLRE